MSELTNSGANPVLALELDRNGNVSKKTMKNWIGKRNSPIASCRTLSRHSRGNCRCASGAAGSVRAGYGRQGSPGSRLTASLQLGGS